MSVVPDFFPAGWRGCAAACVMSLSLTGLAHGATIDCVIAPAMTLHIGSPVPTTIDRVLVDRGDHVQAGQLLATLEHGAEAADVALDEARAGSSAEVDDRVAKMQLAAVEAARASELVRRDAISQQRADETQTDLRRGQEDLAMAVLDHRLAALQLARSRALLAQRDIRSPVDGVVTDRLLGPGEFVQQNSAIVVIAAVKKLRIEAYPPVDAWTQFKVGGTVQVTLTQPSGKVVTANVTKVDRVFDTASGTFGVEADMANSDDQLPAGQRCHLSFSEIGADLASNVVDRR